VRKHRDLRIGVVSVGLGLGLGSFGFLIGDAVREMMAIGNVPLLVGLALIGLWKFGPRD
jgi:hypothetical protein